MEETEEKGLFRPILLQEYHFFGESVGDKAPRDEYEREAEEFFRWFYELASREEGERSTLAFESEHIKVGVILVASSDTFKRHGIDAYLRRANAYASAGFQCIYLCSRGYGRGGIAKQIAQDLIADGCFTQLSKKTDIARKDGEGRTLVITCIALRPNLDTIVDRAWDKVQHALRSGEPISGTILGVQKDQVAVDLYGLRLELEREDLSSIEIPDARKYFEIDQDLQLKVLQVDTSLNKVRLSNKDTYTDPKRLINELDRGGRSFNIRHR